MAPIPRILIVEDDEIIANLISVMLEKKGIQYRREDCIR